MLAHARGLVGAIGVVLLLLGLSGCGSNSKEIGRAHV